MYLLGAVGGFRYQAKLWQLIEDGVLFIHDLNSSELHQMMILMDKYQDTPMDFADASMVVAAETLLTKRVFTLDRDFYVYRLSDKSAFTIVP